LPSIGRINHLKRSSRPEAAPASAGFALILAALLASSWSCSPAQRTTDDLSFRVDSTRLGARFEAPGAFQVQAPLGWEPVSAETIALVMQRVRHDDAPMLLALYRQPEGSALAVSAFPFRLEAKARDSLLRSVESDWRTHNPSAHVQRGSFRHGGAEMSQLMIADSSQVVFKLFVAGPEGPLHQLDYVIPRSVYRRELEAVESSIGSIQTAHRKEAA
jgi:hypothetical protein